MFIIFYELELLFDWVSFYNIVKYVLIKFLVIVIFLIFYIGGELYSLFLRWFWEFLVVVINYWWNNVKDLEDKIFFRWLSLVYDFIFGYFWLLVNFGFCLEKKKYVFGCLVYVYGFYLGVILGVGLVFIEVYCFFLNFG